MIGSWEGAAKQAAPSSPAARALLLAALALLACACDVRVALDLAVDRDGAGTLAATVTADAEALAQARAAGADPLGDLAAAGARLEGVGWRVTDLAREDGARAVTLSASFADAAELEALAGDLAAAVAAPELEPLSDVRLDVGDELVAFAAQASLQPTAAVEDLGLDRAEAEALLARSAGYTITVSLPGELVSTTADDPQAVPLRWDVPAGERVRVFAAARRPRAPVAALALGAGAGLVLAAVAGGVALRRRSARGR